jgi:hypothetical protein
MTKRERTRRDSNPGHESDPLGHRPTLEEMNKNYPVITFSSFLMHKEGERNRMAQTASRKDEGKRRKSKKARH